MPQILLEATWGCNSADLGQCRKSAAPKLDGSLSCIASAMTAAVENGESGRT
jgi:hypothetical protein